MNYVEFHINDWASATVGLSFAERGLYLTMIQVYYRDEMPLAARDIERTLGVRTPDEREALDYLLRTFFDLRGGFYHNSRCDEEIAKYHGRSEGAKKAAHARWGKRQGQAVSDAQSMPDECAEDSEAMPYPMQEPCGNDAPAMRTHPPGNAEPMPTLCGTDASHLAISHLAITTTATGAGADPPDEGPGWWETDDDRLVCQLGAILDGLKHRNAVGDVLTMPPNAVRDFVAKARQAALPLGEEADDAISAMLDDFGNTSRGKKLDQNSKPWAVLLRRWLENQEMRWKEARRHPNAPPRGRVSAKPKYERDREAVRAGLGIAP